MSSRLLLEFLKSDSTALVERRNLKSDGIMHQIFSAEAMEKVKEMVSKAGEQIHPRSDDKYE